MLEAGWRCGAGKQRRLAMLEKLEDLPREIEGVRASGIVTKEDYEDILSPLIDKARRDGSSIRLLYHFGPEFAGFSPGGAWEEARIGLHSLRLFAGCAIVSDVAWLREATRFVSFVMPCPVKVFANSELQQASRWLGALPERAGVSHRLLPESGVILVEIQQALRATDFDALAATADAWIQSHDFLNGLVLHAHSFPGWENLRSLIRHVRFVRDHHRKIKRVALVTDARLASLTPHIADHFVEAEVQRFGYEHLYEAIRWARGPQLEKTT